MVPTGGIIRRKGFRRLAELPGEGRIIPFIIDRENSYLLFLTPEVKDGDTVLTPARIRIYSQDGELKSTVNDSVETPLYKAMAEINEVQYAQNFDVMVLVHENYYPILISLDNDAVSIGKFEISTVVEIVASEKINKGDFFEKDSQYELSGYLVSMNNYPKSVLFLNGRIVFGGTRNDEQRLFFSKVGNIHSFSTYKKYVTETREYADVVGTINLNTNTITISEPYEASKFKNKITDYYIDSGYFPEGTKASGMNGLSIYLSNDTTGVNFSDDIKQSVFEWMQQVNAGDSSWKGNYEVIDPHTTWRINEAYARYKIGKFLFSYDVGGNLTQIWSDEVFTIEQGEVKKCIESIDYLYNYVLERLQRKEYLNGGQFQLFISAFYGYIQGTSIGDAFCFIQTGKKAIVEYYIPQQDNNFWTLPHLIDRKISMDYKQEGAEDEQKGYGTAKLLKRV
ncbi:MAG: hypothetical protein LBK74_00400 [Treponema sp.]|nr:hypothetical protein [Treponema sp.]